MTWGFCGGTLVARFGAPPTPPSGSIEEEEEEKKTKKEVFAPLFWINCCGFFFVRVSENDDAGGREGGTSYS